MATVCHPPTVCHIPSAVKLPQRHHMFITKHIVKPDLCQGCKQRIRFGKTAYRCTECHTLCHADCQNQIALPCTPTPSHEEFIGTIDEFAPAKHPRIPAFVVHCIRDVEKRGLNEAGIYRISGSEKSIKELKVYLIVKALKSLKLKEKLLKEHDVTNLAEYDVHVVCSVLKLLLRSLNDSLVPSYLWSIFVEASQHSEKSVRLESLYQAISQLPESNCDTLAFLMTHLGCIANRDECKMPASNLAIIFAPTIVGCSFTKENDISLTIQNQAKGITIMECLLKDIDSDYWNQVLTIPENIISHAETSAYYQDTPPWVKLDSWL